MLYSLLFIITRHHINQLIKNKISLILEQESKSCVPETKSNRVTQLINALWPACLRLSQKEATTTQAEGQSMNLDADS